MAAGLFIRLATLDSEGDELMGEGLEAIRWGILGLSLSGLPTAGTSFSRALLLGLAAGCWDAEGWTLGSRSAIGLGAPKGRIGLDGYFG